VWFAMGGRMPSSEETTTTDLPGLTPTRSVGGREVAFTGSAAVIPLTAAALVLLLIGSGLMWLGRRRHPA
jgi:LPXTG-motif cell wall-anchored protein